MLLHLLLREARALVGTELPVLPGDVFAPPRPRAPVPKARRGDRNPGDLESFCRPSGARRTVVTASAEILGAQAPGHVLTPFQVCPDSLWLCTTQP